MKFSPVSVASVAALISGAVAQLEVISPGGDNLWWVAESDNTLMWSCNTSPYTNFTVLIANSSPSVLTSPLAIISQQPNYDCSETIAKTLINQPPATGYTIQLADPFNSTNVYAQSQPFEIKSLGSAYPPASATPSTGGSALPSGASSTSAASGSSAGAQSTGAASKNGAAGMTASIAGAAAVAAALGFAMA